MRYITVFGSINMDIVVRLDSYPQKGQTVFGKKLSFIPGGKGANQARSVARLGAKVKLIGKVGQDPFGKTLLKSLEKEGITPDIKISQNESSGVAIIGVDKMAENRIIITPGANYDFSPKEITNKNLQNKSVALSNFEVPKDAVAAFFKQAKKTKAQTILNPSPIGMIPPHLLDLVDYLIVNEHELAYLFKTKKLQMEPATLIKNANRIVGKRQTIIATFGPRGSVAIKGSKVVKAKGFKVKAVDTTGAGDSFMGAFAVALAEGKDLKQSLTFANAAAALKVTKLGASQMPYRHEVDKFIETQKE